MTWSTYHIESYIPLRFLFEPALIFPSWPWPADPRFVPLRGYCEEESCLFKEEIGPVLLLMMGEARHTSILNELAVGTEGCVHKTRNQVSLVSCWWSTFINVKHIHWYILSSSFFLVCNDCFCRNKPILTSNETFQFDRK